MQELDAVELNSVAGGELIAFDDYLIAVGGGIFNGALAGSEFAPYGVVAGAVFGGVDASFDYGTLSFANSAL